jgi:hypothetical protein
MGEVVRVTVGKEQQVRRGEGRMDLYAKKVLLANAAGALWESCLASQSSGATVEKPGTFWL